MELLIGQLRITRPLARWSAGLLALLAAWFAVPTAADDAAEYEIKAAYLYNFAQFVRWRDERPEFPLCVLGEDPFGSALGVLSGEPVGEGMRVALRYAREPGRLAGCRLVFVGTDRRGDVASLEGALGEGVLTVGDWYGFAAQGGIIELYREGDRVRFAVNIDALERSGLEISAELLGLARIVHDGEAR